ncbi:hypothetical protein GCM10011506_44270 [Marivirga lumbricoides]|uniref:Uncharacterized protein n=1 Tax=Marivirga lumbricoides TaxID=1046115 RepID=A0ABQ1N4Q8_9BACT|nr:hypothetical protein GCM10011506_44270 [Marivirga lumbricoides]
MKSNQEILNEIGRKLIQECFDPTYANMESLRKKENPPQLFKDYVEVLSKIDDESFRILQRYMKNTLGNFLFDVLRVFEENEQFKIVYEQEGQQVDLNKISEMLKAEPIIEGGWIERFSKELKNDSPE